MNRRTFLDAASRAALIASWPAWLQSAFAADEKRGNDEAGLAVVSEGYRRAQRAGKPLLVLVIPAKDDDKYYRGRAFGEFLNHATKAQHAPLALCEVICATVAQLQQLVPTVGANESLMLLIETDKLPAEVKRIDGKLPTSRSSFQLTEAELDAELPAKSKEKEQQKWARHSEARQRIENRDVNQRIDRIAALLLQGVMATGSDLEKRVAQQKSHTPAPLIQSIEQKLAGGRDGELTTEELDLGAAQVAQYAQGAQVARKNKLLELLGSAVETKLLRSRVPGSKWANSGGCGTRIEGEEQRVMVACGMGHVPAKSSRFLYFFTK